MTITTTQAPAGADIPFTADAFRSVFRSHPAGVTVIAGLRDGRPVGFTATSVISVAAEPPLLAFSLPETSSSWPAVRDAATLTVSFLHSDQREIAARFATSGIDRFAGGGWSALPSGEPVIDGAQSWIRGIIVQRTAVGGSRLVTLQAIASSPIERPSGHEASPPLVYHDRSYHRIGAHSAIA